MLGIGLPYNKYCLYILKYIMDSIITQVERPQQQQQQTQQQQQPQPEQHIHRRRINRIIKWMKCCCCCCKKRKQDVKVTASVTATSTTITTTTNNSNNIENEVHLLPPPPTALNQSDEDLKIVMVIDLDETLVHSSFKPIDNPDFIVPVEIDGQVHNVYVLKRPFVDEFLKKMGELYECVLFTASLSKYADPVADLLDQWGVFKTRLFREACVFYRGNYVKDLNKLGRDLKRTIIIDNSPASYIFHPDNAVPVASWFDDTNDTELLYLIPFFERLATVDNVYTVLRNSNHPFNLNSNVSSGSGDKILIKDEKL